MINASVQVWAKCYWSPGKGENDRELAEQIGKQEA